MRLSIAAVKRLMFPIEISSEIRPLRIKTKTGNAVRAIDVPMKSDPLI